MKEIEWKIIDWAADRGIYDQSTVDKQMHKLVSEVGELADAILDDNMSLTIDGIGDCMVVLTNLAHMIGTDLEACYLAAWKEIKGRKGKMVNGVFVKATTYNSHWDSDGRCKYCGAGDDIHHSYTCPTCLHPDKRWMRETDNGIQKGRFGRVLGLR